MATTQKQNDEFSRAIFPNYPLDEAINWIRRNLYPEDVFDSDILDEWAKENGFVPEED